MPTLKVALDARKYKQGAEQVKRSAGVVKTASKGARDEIGRFQKQSNALGISLKGVAGIVGKLGGGLSALLAIRQTLKLWAEFEETMLTVKGVARATEEDFVRLTKTAREMGATTRFSAVEAGQGLLFLSRAGFDANEAIQALPHTLNLAAAGAISLGEAADYASNIISQFNLEIEETDRVVDSLVNTANSANTDVRQLAEALKFVGPVAGAIGHSLEGTTAAIGALGDAGIQGSMAGTNLRGILASLLGPTGGAEKSMKRLGLSIADLDPTTNSMVDIFKKLEASGMKASDAVAIFGRRNAAAALILAGNVDKVEELTEANIAARGEAQRMADLINSSMLGSWKNLTSAVSEFTLAQGTEGVVGALKSTLKSMAEVVRILADVEGASNSASATSRNLAEAVKFVGQTMAIMVGVKIATMLWGLAKSARAAGSAMLFLKNTMKAHPILLIASIISTVVWTFNELTNSTDSSSESMGRLDGATNEVSASLQRLFDIQQKIKTLQESGTNEKVLQQRQNEVAVVEEMLNKLKQADVAKFRPDFSEFKDVGGIKVGSAEGPLAVPFGPENALAMSDAEKLLKSLGIEYEQLIKIVESGSGDTQAIFLKDYVSLLDEYVAKNKTATTSTIQSLEQIESEIKAFDAFNKIKANVALEQELVFLDTKERQKYMVLRKAEALLDKSGVSNKQVYLDALEKEIDLNNQLKESYVKSQEEKQRLDEEKRLINEIEKKKEKARRSERPLTGTIASTVEVRGQFTGLNAQFSAQQNTLVNIGQSTKDTAENTNRMVSLLEDSEDGFGTPNLRINS